MLRRLAFAALVVAVLAAPAQAQAGRAREIEAQLARLRQQVAALETELLALRLKSPGGKPATVAELRDLKVGMVVQLLSTTRRGLDLKVREVIDARQMILTHADDPGFAFLLRGHPTAGHVDGQIINGLRGAWQVSGTARVAGRTLLVVEPLGAAPPGK